MKKGIYRFGLKSALSNGLKSVGIYIYGNGNTQFSKRSVLKSLKTLNISRWTRLLYNAPLYFTLHCILYHKLPVDFFNTYTVYLEKGTVNSKCSLASQYTVHLYNYEFHAGYQDT